MLTVFYSVAANLYWPVVNLTNQNARTKLVVAYFITTSKSNSQLMNH